MSRHILLDGPIQCLGGQHSPPKEVIRIINKYSKIKKDETMTKKEFKRLWNGLLTHFNARVIKKSDDELMEAIASFLDVLKIQNREAFLNNWAITLRHNIYLPFTVGDDSKITLEEQLIVLCHELTHVPQWDDPLFVLRYVSSTAHRAEEETEALIAGLEACHLLIGALPPLNEEAVKLKAYGCKKADIKVVEKALTMASIKIEKGGVSTEAGKVLRKLMLS